MRPYGRPPLTAAELLKHPEYEHVTWDLKPAQKGKVAVAEGRGGPIQISYEVHGNGPTKLVVGVNGAREDSIINSDGDCTKAFHLPKAIDDQLDSIKARTFSQPWLNEPDAEGHFPTNGDRWAAQEVTKRRDVEGFTRRGFILQAIAANWHHKSAVQLNQLGDQVGRNRILVIHGTADKMITQPHGELLVKELGGEEKGVTR
ncbi:MAG: hypothetical protein ASARMPREDX12_008758, partial [Alectoria sarmentosa]